MSNCHSEKMLVENNKDMLEKLKNGEIQNEDMAIGSFFMCIFGTEELIRLFFEYLEWKFDTSYAEATEWVCDCRKEGIKAHDEFVGKIGKLFGE